MTLIGERRLVHGFPRADPVSILVFLDDAHRLGRQRRHDLTHREVSILVFLDDAHRPVNVCGWISTARVFQSLFSWMTLIGFGRGEIAPAPRQQFQSLFSWMTLIGPARDRGSSWVASGFQSLFSWMTLIGVVAQGFAGPADLGFQSLFSWMTLIGISAALASPASAMFQSLFSWMTLIGPARSARRPGGRGVSILVFLDDAHRQCVEVVARVRGPRVSILVFLDDAHRRHAPDRALRRSTFQSLFSWMTLIGPAPRRVPGRADHGFNPCFLG